MDTLIEYLRELAKEIPLETEFDWPLPAKLPIDIPVDVKGAFSQNIYLKENLAPLLENDHELTIHYWIIREWGGIRTFQVGDRNNKLIRAFKEEVRRGRLTQKTFAKISSLSKLSSFWEPERYAIYDSRAIFSLNWLIFRHCKDKKLFRQPLGRSSVISRCDTQTLFTFSKIEHRYRPDITAFHDYCALLQDLSEQIYDNRRPYYVEMLLFLSAPTKYIIGDIENSVTVIISDKGRNHVAQP
jgi:hypothetical protein